jgi:hypothetical protein
MTFVFGYPLIVSLLHCGRFRQDALKRRQVLSKTFGRRNEPYERFAVFGDDDFFFAGHFQIAINFDFELGYADFH